MSISRKVGQGWKSLELSSVSIAKSVGGGRVVSAEWSGWDIVGVDIIVLEDCSSAVL